MKSNQKSQILVVDNNESILGALQASLENAGFETRTTWSGIEALELLGAGETDVLVVDDYLPDLHATDFLERVSRLPIQPWVVVMQSLPPKPAELSRYEKLGASAVVQKSDVRKVCGAVKACCATGKLGKADTVTRA